MGDLVIAHDILLEDSDFDSCHKRVSRFFETTMLIRYDEAKVLENESINGADSEFRMRLQAGLAENQQAIENLLKCLTNEGFAHLEDLKGVEKGYISKVFHTVAHLLDGFIGIDSFFYNLEEDSHGISRNMQQLIESDPGSFWIVRVNGRIASTAEDPLDALRTFEKKRKTRD